MRFMHFVSPAGRIGRGSWWALMMTAAALPWSPYLVASLLWNEPANFSSVVLASMVGFWIAASASIKRLHDLERSAMLIWLAIVPVVSFFFAIWLGFFPGTRGPNGYGIPHSGSPFAHVI